MLDIVEERRKGGNNSAVFTFLKSTLAIAFPSPGETFKVTTFATSSNTPAEYSLTRPATDDYLLDYISFHHLFNAFKITQIITLFECLLLEVTFLYYFILFYLFILFLFNYFLIIFLFFNSNLF